MNTSQGNKPKTDIGKQKRIIKKSLKIGAWIVGCVAALLVITLCALVWVLTPERLTPLVNQIASESINANVHVKRAELTAWSTFPDLTVDIDGLCIVSKSLNGLPADKRAALPTNADSLASATHIHAGVNVLKILYGTFSLKDLSAKDLNLNLVAVDENTANYLVALPTDEPESDEPLSLPTLYWNRFSLDGNTRIAYFNAADTIDTHIQLTKAALNRTDDDDTYALSLNGNADYAMGGMEYVKNLPLNFNGDIEWNSKHLATVGINNLKATILDIPATMNMHLAMDNAAMIDQFNLDLGPVKFASVVQILPKIYSDLFANIKSDAKALIKAKLNEPYDLNGTNLPSIGATLVIPDSYIATSNGKARLDRIAMDASMTINGKHPDNSVITLKRMILGGEAVNLQLDGTVDNFFTDAHITGNLKGNADLGKIVQVFNLPVSFSIKGEMEANTSISAHMSDFTANRFQRMAINGDVDFRNLHYNSVVDTISLYARNACFQFGSNDEMKFNGREIPDLLHCSLSIDTMSAFMSGMKISLAKAKAGIGCVGDVMALADTTLIIPIGTRIKSERLSVEQADGTKIKARGISCEGSISRYENEVRVPKIHLAMGANALAYLSKDAGVLLRDSKVNLFANLRKRNDAKARLFRNKIDSIRHKHPTWSMDSVLLVASNGRFRPDNANSGKEIIDMSIDKSFHKMLINWQMHGNVSSSRGRFFTPYFPLRNSLSNVNVDFSIDSVRFNSLTYNVGQSHFDVKGSIRNIRSALLGNNRHPLGLIFFIKADTLNINQLIKAATDGMAYANTGEKQTYTNAQSEKVLEQITNNATAQSDTVLAAFVVPSNIDANIRLRASDIIYADMFMKKFNGDVLMHDGVLNLRELRAKTDIGSARFNALYAAPDRKDIKFGFDLSLEDIQVGKFLRMMPAVDSIMPLLESVDGVIDADIAATTNVDSTMNVIIPSLKAAMKLHGKDLVFMDAATFKKIARMLLFKNKNRNKIDEMTVELLVENSQLELYPFMFNVDRYRLGVLGHNDLDMNFRYHISVLKSPIPFKFGINIYGNPDKMHFRFGGAKYKDNIAREQVKIVDTTRINLRNQINSAFHRGAKAALKSELQIDNRPAISNDLKIDTTSHFSHEDSVQMIQGGFIPAPPAPPAPATPAPATATDGKKKSTKKSKKATAAATKPQAITERKEK